MAKRTPAQRIEAWIRRSWENPTGYRDVLAWLWAGQPQAGSGFLSPAATLSIRPEVENPGFWVLAQHLRGTTTVLHVWEAPAATDPLEAAVALGVTLRPHHTPAQKAATERNWNWARVLGASSIIGIRTLGDPENDADLKLAAEALRRISDRHRDQQTAQRASAWARWALKTPKNLQRALREVLASLGIEAPQGTLWVRPTLAVDSRWELAHEDTVFHTWGKATDTQTALTALASEVFLIIPRKRA